MYQIKTFYAPNDTEVNTWLAENPDIEVMNISKHNYLDYYQMSQPPQVCNQYVEMTVLYRTVPVAEVKKPDWACDHYERHVCEIIHKFGCDVACKIRIGAMMREPGHPHPTIEEIERARGSITSCYTD